MKEPCIAYAKFADVCARHNLDDVSTKTLATLMHDLGYIVYYGDDERLKNDVVLQPEWLTKAIGFVLEDRKTQEMDGILPDDRLKEVWWDHPFKGEQKYEPMLYPAPHGKVRCVVSARKWHRESRRAARPANSPRAPLACR
jgi:hypothetical protein